MKVQSQFIEMFGNCLQVEKLSSLCDTFLDGDWIESKDQSDEGIRLVQTGNVGNGIFKNKEDKCRFISDKTFDRLHCTEIFSGDILVSRLPDPIGRACMIPNGLGRMITAVDCSIIRLKESILPDFFIAYTMTPTYRAQINEVTTGTTRRRVSRANLGNVKVPVPPMEQQQQFVSIAHQADKSKFVGFKSQFIEMAGDLPKNGTLSDYCEMKAGKSIKSDSINSQYNDGLYPCYGGNGLRGYVETYSHDGVYNIIGRQGALCGNITLTKGKFYATEHAIVVRPKTPINEYWLYFALAQMNLNQYARGVAQPGLAVKQLEKLPFGIPSKGKQEKFAAVYQQADKSKYFKLTA